jgi:Ca-activated chloride channel homolog
VGAAFFPVREDSVTFARPALLGLAFILPGLFAIFIALYASRRRRVASLLGESDLIARLGGARLHRFPTTRLLLFTIAGTSLGIAAAGPRWGSEVTRGQAQALSVVLALDISKSMLTTDVSPSRLEQQRLLVRRMLREMPSDRFGLIVFAGRAYVLSPVTIDHSALELYTDALAPDIVSQGGSSIAAAITLSTELARGNKESTEHAVVLVSDGEALEESDAIEDAIARASREGVHVFTVGTGTSAGGPVPDLDPRTGAIGGFKRDELGNTVVSRLDAPLLRHIAEKTGGEYVELDRPGAADRLAQLLNRLDRSTETSEQRVQKKDRFALFVLLALLCVILDTGLAAAPAAPATRVAGGAPRRSIGTAATGAPPRARKRRLGTTAVLLLVTFGASVAFGIGDLERGNRLYNEGRYAEAAAAYQKALESGRPSPALYYNLGTSLVQLGRFEEAGKYLNTAIEAVDPDVRNRALYNMGNRFLYEARAGEKLDPQAKATLLDAAAEAYRRSLRMNPSDVNAKWNLELTLRDLERNKMEQPKEGESDKPDQQPQDDKNQNGGGAASSQAQAPAGQGQSQGSNQQQKPLSKEQADRILSAIEQDERQLTRQTLRKGQMRTTATRDW